LRSWLIISEFALVRCCCEVTIDQHPSCNYPSGHSAHFGVGGWTECRSASPAIVDASHLQLSAIAAGSVASTFLNSFPWCRKLSNSNGQILGGAGWIQPWVANGLESL